MQCWRAQVVLFIVKVDICSTPSVCNPFTSSTKSDKNASILPGFEFPQNTPTTNGLLLLFFTKHQISDYEVWLLLYKATPSMPNCNFTVSLLPKWAPMCSFCMSFLMPKWTYSPPPGICFMLKVLGVCIRVWASLGRWGCKGCKMCSGAVTAVGAALQFVAH